MSRPRRGLSTCPPSGTRVRLTGYFLRATGQVTGGEGSKRWSTIACACGLCQCGGFAAVDEAIDTRWFEDLPPEERPQWRHIALGNLEIVGAKPRAADQADEVKS